MGGGLCSYLRLCHPRLGRNHVALLCFGKEAFGVDANYISNWWLIHRLRCDTITLVFTYAVGNIGAPGRRRAFESYDMMVLMANLIGVRHDIRDQLLIQLKDQDLQQSNVRNEGLLLLCKAQVQMLARDMPSVDSASIDDAASLISASPQSLTSATKLSQRYDKALVDH